MMAVEIAPGPEFRPGKSHTVGAPHISDAFET
jgi:hypothetical protein